MFVKLVKGWGEVVGRYEVVDDIDRNEVVYCDNDLLDATDHEKRYDLYTLKSGEEVAIFNKKLSGF